jgi:adenine-specific DNA-methyltransferase
MSKYNELVTKLREIFQIDRPELDFGIYRILNARAGEINQYLEQRLPEKVKQALSAGSAAQQAQAAQELKDKEAQYQADGIDPSTVPKVQELRQKLAQYTTGANEHENAVFSHLLAFFSRYFDNGDFISQRRYKGDTYAIPYAGEEVMLHWANKDQYYTKSGENFANYSFKLEDGRTVHFRLVAADTAKDNRKDNDKERRFALVERKTVTRIDEQGEAFEEELLPVEEVDGPASAENAKPVAKELIIRFEYKAAPKGTKQEALAAQAVEAVLADVAVKARWLGLGQRAPTEKNPQRTLLEKHLSDYTSKNTADYFIHKDLGGFLKRELDFYIKNEVMHLDDVQNASAFADIEKNLRMIQCLRAIALELIAFLAQLEDFQKKLWLKKKFVVSSHYCMTLDRVPEALWPQVVANEQQWAQWKQLGVWGGDAPGTIEDLKAAPYRMVDTALFADSFISQLFKSIANADLAVEGVVVNSDNFQAMRLLSTRLAGQIKGIYIDPPFNTGDDGFLYKDGYSHSSWAALISSRIGVAKSLLSESAAIWCNLNDLEDWRMRGVIESAYGADSYITTVVTKSSTTSSFRTVNLGPVDVTDRIILFAKNRAKYSYTTQFVPKGVDLQHFSRFVVNSEDLPENWQFASIKLHVLQGLGIECSTTQQGMKLAREKWGDAAQSVVDSASEQFAIANAKRVFETKTLQKPSPWIRPIIEESKSNPSKIIVAEREGADPIILMGGRQFYFLGKGVVMVGGKPVLTEPASTLWLDIDTNNLKHEGGVEFPKGKKPLRLLQRIIGMADAAEGEWFADFFAGSGSTGHAILQRIRENGPSLKYLLIEQGDYFNTVLKPRLEKVAFSPVWKDNQPVAPDKGMSHCFKVLKLESYEDTLNNLQLRRPSGTGDLFNGMPKEAQDDYLLRYMLDVESRGSLLSVDDFKKPFDYTLNVAVDSAGAFEPRKIDLVETFNYLVGLRVKHIDAQPERGFVTITGTLPSGESCLVLWRDCDKLDYEGLSKLCDKLAINPADNEYDVVYLNGDHNIPTKLTQMAVEGGATRELKLRQIEPEFLERMFSVEDI